MGGSGRYVVYTDDSTSRGHTRSPAQAGGVHVTKHSSRVISGCTLLVTLTATGKSHSNEGEEGSLGKSHRIRCKKLRKSSEGYSLNVPNRRSSLLAQKELVVSCLAFLYHG